MPVCRRSLRRGPRCRGRGDISVITDRRDCGSTFETITEELYDAPHAEILMLDCCDSICGSREINARRRCQYWPNFAHPRWLSCRELNNRRLR